MLSRISLFGRTRVEPQLVTMVYGINKPPWESAAPTGYIDDEDLEVTDTEKGFWAHDGQSQLKIKRRFYEINKDDVAAVVKLCQDSLDEMIREFNRK
jgi:hypothetical protein